MCIRDRTSTRYSSTNSFDVVNIEISSRFSVFVFGVVSNSNSVRYLSPVSYVHVHDAHTVVLYFGAQFLLPGIHRYVFCVLFVFYGGFLKGPAA